MKFYQELLKEKLLRKIVKKILIIQDQFKDEELNFSRRNIHQVEFIISEYFSLGQVSELILNYSAGKIYFIQQDLLI